MQTNKYTNTQTYKHTNISTDMRAHIRTNMNTLKLTQETNALAQTHIWDGFD